MTSAHSKKPHLGCAGPLWLITNGLCNPPVSTLQWLEAALASPEPGHKLSRAGLQSSGEGHDS